MNALLSRDGIDINQAKKNGVTPLYIACQNGHLDVVNALLSTDGIDINQAETQYGSPLIAACYFGRANIAELLLGYPGPSSCNVSLECAGKTALQWARPGVRHPAWSSEDAAIDEDGRSKVCALLSNLN